MTSFTRYTGRPPRTLTSAEQQLLLEVTAEDHASYRDHVIYSMALATGLREHELVALNVGDVYHGNGQPRQWITLRVFKQSTRHRGHQEVLLPDALREKLATFRDWKRYEGEGLSPSAPLFLSRIGRRLSKRQLRHGFTVWQRRAGFERRHTFHSLRHTACDNLYRLSRDIRLTQRFARHSSLNTTMIYTHPSDDYLVQTVQGLTC